MGEPAGTISISSGFKLRGFIHLGQRLPYLLEISTNMGVLAVKAGSSASTLLKTKPHLEQAKIKAIIISQVNSFRRKPT